MMTGTVSGSKKGMTGAVRGKGKRELKRIGPMSPPGLWGSNENRINRGGEGATNSLELNMGTNGEKRLMITD